MFECLKYCQKNILSDHENRDPAPALHLVSTVHTQLYATTSLIPQLLYT